MNGTGKMDAYELVTEGIIDRLEQGTAPWRQAWHAGSEGPRNIEGHAYRGINVFLLLASGYGSPYWLTFNQAKERGGSVRKGEKGTRVIFWKMLASNREDEDGEHTTRQIPMLRYFTVFNLEQTDGVKLPAAVRLALAEESNHPQRPAVDAAEAILASMANPPSYRESGSRAFYQPASDLVGMPARESFDGMNEFYCARFHETGHATGHASRLNRKGIMERHEFGDYDYGQEELVAEMTAAFLCGESGILPQTIDNSASYLASWIRTLRGDKKLVVMAAAQAQKAADYIMGWQVGIAAIEAEAA